MLPYRVTKQLRGEDFRVSADDRPGWVRGTARTPVVGEEIFCAAGAGMVMALLGKTGDGSRLVQIGLASPANPPFFAAASNVLLRPGAAMASSAAAHDDAEFDGAPDAWIAGSGSRGRIG